MAHPATVVPGNCYFLVGYADRDLLVPLIDTIIYRRIDEDPDGKQRWIFEYPVVEGEAEDEGENEPAPSLLAIPADQLYDVLDFDGLRRVLMELSDFHPHQMPPPRTAVSGLNLEVAAELRRRLNEFADNADHSSVTLSIYGTDDGFSVTRRKARGLEIDWSSHPKLNPGEGARILALFRRLEIRPHKDYLADKGRTRLLAFECPDDVDALLALCVQALTDVYDVREDDRLCYSYLAKSDFA